MTNEEILQKLEKEIHLRGFSPHTYISISGITNRNAFMYPRFLKLRIIKITDNCILQLIFYFLT